MKNQLAGRGRYLRTSRPVRAAILAASIASLMLSGVASADSTSGSTGNYLFTDSQSTTGATCRYAPDSRGQNLYHVTKIVVRPPSVWWPDQNSSSNSEHGRVGWQATVGRSTDGMNWTLVQKSAVQRATAYEDSQSPYGRSTRAPFTKISVPINGANFALAENFRVTVKALWYTPEGKVRGFTTHIVTWYSEKVGTFNTAQQGSCSNAVYLITG